MQSHKPVTIKDIAKKCHCSPSTVSRALNNHPLVNDFTRRQIQEFAAKVGYQRNPVSLNLLNKRTNSVGIVVPYMQGYFFSALIDGIESILVPRGYTVTICQSKEHHNTEVGNVGMMLANRVEGIFVAASKETRDYAHFERVVERGIPLIFIDRDCIGFEGNKVLVNDYDGAFKAVEHLIQMGARRIAHLKGPDNLSVSLQRLNGYLDALRKYDMPLIEELILTCGFRTPHGMQASKTLLNLSHPPDAIFAANDNIAISAMHVIHDLGFRIPDDIAVVGFDNDPHSAYLTPSLTTVAQPVYELGQEAANLFLSQVNEEAPSKGGQKIVLPCELIIRQSSLKVSMALQTVSEERSASNLVIFR